MTDPFTLADAAAQLILQRSSVRPQIALVLGSGLGGFADSLEVAVRIPYSEIPSFPRSTAIGHAGQLVIGNAGPVAVAAMQGRVQLYEGY
jgi:purine-nucleoside phosphorylase